MKLSKYIVTGALTTLTILSGFVESADAQRSAQRYSGDSSASTNGRDFDRTSFSFAIFEDGIEDSLTEGADLIAEGADLIAEGADLIAEGADLIAEGEALLNDNDPDNDPEGQDLRAQGEALRAEGQFLRAEGQDLRAQGQELQDSNSLFVGAVPFYSDSFSFALESPNNPRTGGREFQNLDLLVERFGNLVRYDFINEQQRSVFYSDGTFSNNNILAATNDLSFIANNFPLDEDILSATLTFTSNNDPSLSGGLCSSIGCFSTSQNSITIPDPSTPPPQSVPEPNSISAIFVLSILSYGLWNKAKKRSF